MTEIPKIVRERLQGATRAVESHPDPNVLTAFAEQTLPQAERSTVLQHLARCADCREILALALPAYEPVPVVAKVPAISFAWPRIRWAFASAALVVVVLIGVKQFGHRNPSVQMAKNNEAPSAMQKYEEPVPAAQSQTAAHEEATQSEAARKSKALIAKDEFVPVEKDKNAPSSPVPPSLADRNVSNLAVGGRLAHGPRQMTQWQQQSANVQQVPGPALASNAVSATRQSAGAAASAPGRTTTQMVEVQIQGATPELKSDTADALVADNRVSSQPNASDTEVSRAKSALAPTVATASPIPAQGRALQAVSSKMTWTITSGRLQRSFDQGATWQDVNLNASLDTSTSLELTAARKVSKESQKRDKKERPAPVVFRAVAAIGFEVWAGGTNAALFHSSDAGGSWFRVTPTSGNATMTGDVVALDFPEPNRGRVSTSTGEIWTTSDGQNWQKR